jgi:DNA-binding transcriptional regulator YhcF (GntR family)
MKDIIRMNQLAGIITEGQAKKMSKVLTEEMDAFDYSNLIQSVINQLTDMGDAGEQALAVLEKIEDWNEMVQAAVNDF